MLIYDFCDTRFMFPSVIRVQSGHPLHSVPDGITTNMNARPLPDI